MATPKAITSEAEFDSVLSSAPPNKLVVVDFTATWCGPCNQIAPFYQTLSTKYRHCIFLKVDVDANQPIASKYGVTAMPTFVFFKGSSKIAEVKGANPNGLESAVKEHQGPVDVDSIPSGPGGHIDLADQVEKRQIECLNQKAENPFANAFEKGDSFLESDVDEQLIISIPFQQTVKLHSIKIRGDPEKFPKTIKTFINLPTCPSFEDAEERAFVEELTIPPPTDGESIINLRYVKYQNVVSLQMFVLENQNDTETTAIKQITLYGSPVETTKSVDQLQGVKM